MRYLCLLLFIFSPFYYQPHLSSRSHIPASISISDDLPLFHLFLLFHSLYLKKPALPARLGASSIVMLATYANFP
ncbi:hypothetical protein DFS34DRAFT_617869 [Phlyctochytrium arcticum]|nr:hypothetical protein DFS34DRAFT_617869 [Phlyctochytrium arcticum]